MTTYFETRAFSRDAASAACPGAVRVSTLTLCRGLDRDENTSDRILLVTERRAGAPRMDHSQNGAYSISHLSPFARVRRQRGGLYRHAAQT